MLPTIRKTIAIAASIVASITALFHFALSRYLPPIPDSQTVLTTASFLSLLILLAIAGGVRFFPKAHVLRFTWFSGALAVLLLVAAAWGYHWLWINKVYLYDSDSGSQHVLATFHEEGRSRVQAVSSSTEPKDAIPKYLKKTGQYPSDLESSEELWHRGEHDFTIDCFKCAYISVVALLSAAIYLLAIATAAQVASGRRLRKPPIVTNNADAKP